MSIFEIINKGLSQDSEAIIFDAPEATLKFGRTTFSENVHLAAAVTVKKRTTISTLLKLANEHHFALYPISTGNNWGYGSIAESKDKPRVIIDLSQLKGIYPASKELGLITVEPGVTQQDLFDYLAQNDWPYMTPVTGAGPNCSILSNALERGYGITPHAMHFDAVTAMKVYLPHPDLCHEEMSSAISELDKSGSDFIDKTFKHGLGPAVDGLFTQSNLGIVTECTIRLAKRRSFSSFYLRCFDKQGLPKLVNFIHQVLQEFEGVVGSINLMDKNRVISMTADNPNPADIHRVMTSEQVSKIEKEHGTPEWMIIGTIYGNKRVVDASEKEIKKMARGTGSIIFSSSPLLSLANQLTKAPFLKSLSVVKKVKGQLDALEEGQELMLGKPNQLALKLAYWRNAYCTPDKTKSLLPDKDKCGLLWYAPLIPMCADKIDEYVAMIRDITPKYGVEPLITFTNLRHDCIDSTVPILFNLEDPEAVDQSKACLEELVSVGRQKGFVPYRLNIEQQASLLDKNAIYWQAVDNIKSSLDPNRIISPGRYNPR
ncbi:FAD-dependent oxidoreductase [Aestuariibacter sp. AA17]|uniref:FAD-dependent oxidoreductase n=1 Tax=Fluctibacter corallii TaxID=2984329 RepID=A0ABT3ABF6_9ALTE|nr:FAD-dependent oxidoreductase [Aestuariibacter sp. AA17]MCV2886013.1 FAD-dependent oxidoreductase [Aestuariibacter sp. AA17]